jgi:hypothetical protein
VICACGRWRAYVRARPQRQKQPSHLPHLGQNVQRRHAHAHQPAAMQEAARAVRGRPNFLLHFVQIEAHLVAGSGEGVGECRLQWRSQPGAAAPTSDKRDSSRPANHWSTAGGAGSEVQGSEADGRPMAQKTRVAHMSPWDDAALRDEKDGSADDRGTDKGSGACMPGEVVYESRVSGGLGSGARWSSGWSPGGRAQARHGGKHGVRAFGKSW